MTKHKETSRDSVGPILIEAQKSKNDFNYLSTCGTQNKVSGLDETNNQQNFSRKRKLRDFEIWNEKNLPQKPFFRDANTINQGIKYVKVSLLTQLFAKVYFLKHNFDKRWTSLFKR